jgi:hypothetical protein
VISSVEGNDETAGITVIVPTALREQYGENVDQQPKDIESIKRLIRSPNTITLAHIHELHYTSLTPISTTSTTEPTPPAAPPAAPAAAEQHSLFQQHSPHSPTYEKNFAINDEELTMNSEDDVNIATNASQTHSTTTTITNNLDHGDKLPPLEEEEDEEDEEEEKERTEEDATNFSPDNIVTINGRNYFISPNQPTSRTRRSPSLIHDSYPTLTHTLTPAFDYMNDVDEYNNDNFIDDWPYYRRRRRRPSLSS